LGVLIVQLGLVTEDLNRRWYELNSGHRIGDAQRHAVHRTLPWMTATLDGFTVPLCRTHHRDNHRFGEEAAWWGRQAIDPVGTSRKLWVSTRRIE
jgi:hypothetical protein